MSATVLTPPEPAIQEIPPHRRPPTRRTPRAVLAALQVAFALNLVVFGFIGYLTVLTPLQEQRDQDVMFDRLRAELAAVTAPIGGAIEPGRPIAVLSIDAIGLEAVVVEGTSAQDTVHGPGHRRDTPLPGQAGVSLIYGRRSTFGAPFERVPDLSVGTVVDVVTGQGRFGYRVEGTRREGDPVPRPLAAGTGRLTLVTTESPQPFTASETVFVDAALVGAAQSAPGGRPRLIPDYERALRSDPNAMFPLVLWLQALVLAVAGATWARLRWGKVEAWIVGTPIVLACAWHVFGTAVRLLPNLL